MISSSASSSMVRPSWALGLLGGAFDPVHIGHLRGALAVLDHLGLKRVDLLPAAQSPLKHSACVDSAHRLAMLEIAVSGVPGLGIDARELDRAGPSYTVDTLAAIRQESDAHRPIIWIMGSDGLTSLLRWSRWEQLLELTHVVVMDRPGASPVPREVSQWLDAHRASSDWLLSHPAGGVLMLHQPLLDIASSEIRGLIQRGKNPRFLLPDAVMEYISTHDLFAPPAL